MNLKNFKYHLIEIAYLPLAVRLDLFLSTDPSIAILNEALPSVDTEYCLLGFILRLQITESFSKAEFAAPSSFNVDFDVILGILLTLSNKRANTCLSFMEISQLLMRLLQSLWAISFMKP